MCPFCQLCCTVVLDMTCVTCHGIMRILSFTIQWAGGIPGIWLTGLYSFFFFFSSRRRHTRSLCDWSSDVCSSDLRSGAAETARWPKQSRRFGPLRDCFGHRAVSAAPDRPRTATQRQVSHSFSRRGKELPHASSKNDVQHGNFELEALAPWAEAEGRDLGAGIHVSYLDRRNRQ